MSKSFDQNRTDEQVAVNEAIDALSDASDLDTLLEQQRAIRDRLLSAWSSLIGDEEHTDWLDTLDSAARKRERELRLENLS